jgi:hypothetical protein
VYAFALLIGPPPDKVFAGQPSDPPNLWTGVCQTAVAATLRHKEGFVNLTTPGARIRCVTRTSGFHVVRPVLKLADGSFVVGDSADGVHRSNSQLFLESELAIANVRWLPLDITRVVTRGEKWVQPDLGQSGRSGLRRPAPGQWTRVGRVRERRPHRGLRNAGQEMITIKSPSPHVRTWALIAAQRP